MNYKCYGLIISSEIALPELLPIQEGIDECKPDVRITIGKVPWDGLADGKQMGRRLWATEGTLWLHIPGIARFLMRNGQEILIDPDAGADEDIIRLYLQGSAFGAILFQRGLLVLHGNAISVGDGCMICVGDSGAGKSTLAAAFMQRGYKILADDVAPVNAQCMALPGFPRIKLWQDAANRLSIETDGLRRIRPGEDKYHLPAPESFADQPLRVKWIYALDRHPHMDILFEPIAGMGRFELLRQNTYRARYVKALGLEGEHLKLCAQLSERIHLARLSRPEHGNSMDRLVDSILADIAAHP